MPSSRHLPPEAARTSTAAVDVAVDVAEGAVGNVGDTADAHLIEKTLGGETLHSGFVELHRDTVRLPDGSSATREYIRHNGAVAVVPLLDDSADPQLVLVRQYRYPLGKVLLEWPAGKLEKGEAQLACAMRELEEETGYSAAEWAYGGEIHNAAAYSTESIWLWFARGLKPGAKRPDEGEFVETVQMPLSALQQQADAGTLPDVKTQVGLAWLQRVLAGHRTLQWEARPAEQAAEQSAQQPAPHRAAQP